MSVIGLWIGALLVIGGFLLDNGSVAADGPSVEVIDAARLIFSETNSSRNEDFVHLIVNYFIDGEDEPFYQALYSNKSGAVYSIASPEIEGYLPEISRLQGIFSEDQEIAVVYHQMNYSLTVHYRLLDGNPAAPDHQEDNAFGTEYLIPSPEISGYFPVLDAVEGSMPGRDVERTVFYVPNSAVFVN